MEVEEVVDEIMRDEDFYRNSGGGVTVSGGEALAQSNFVAALLEICQKRGLHTALDTTGHATWKRMSQALKFADLILFDVKHLDRQKHKEATGVSNDLILANLRRVARTKPIWLRMPVIAGFNDSEDYVRQIIALAKAIAVEKISLLPYHEGGQSKSLQLGRTYKYPGANSPSDEHVNVLKELIVAEGINASVGN